MKISSNLGSAGDTPLKMHEDREAAIQELHARPPLAVVATDTILHVGFSCDGEVLQQVIEKLNNSGSTVNDRHQVFQIGSMQVKLERHTEFTSLTFVVQDADRSQDPFELINPLLPIDQLNIIILLQINMCGNSKELIKNTPFGERVFGGTMRGGLDVRSTLSPMENGAIFYAVQASKGSPDEIGRRLQRLIEVETYRTMSLLGLPTARRMGSRLAMAENEVMDVISAMNDGSEPEEQNLFDEMLRLSRESNAMQSQTRFRFSASRAYYDLVVQRLASLEETKFGDLQTITGFVRSRLDPAMATIESVARRQETLIEDISSALSLLRTRIDLGLNRDNQELLKSMDARHRQQVLISQTVEGLSVVAITYYAVGLLTYGIKAIEDWLPVGWSYKIVVAMCVPIVFFSVWLFLRKMHSKWSSDSGHE